ncbi:hypothetical protein N431DRAFT_357289 [Stipitochalara longipes BDJ]|nr:hypothetical protein N431DRAFT_357289 [Stipitochalara longipes BDJ]
MFKRLRNTFGKGSNDRRESSSSAFDWQNVANLSSSNLPHQDVARQPTTFFNSQVHQAGLHQMTIELEIWRTGAVTEDDMNLVKVPSSRFLENGKDADRVHNYNFESFLETIQCKLNKGNPAHPTEMMFGQLGFLDHNGIYEAVGDQDSFGVALNNLYLNRGNNNVLKFVFQPEIEEYRKKRLEIQDENNETRFLGAGDKLDRRVTFPGDKPSKIFQRHQQPERLNPFIPFDSEKSLKSSGRPQSGLSAQVLHLVGLSNHAGLSSIRRQGSDPTVTISPPSPHSTSGGKQSHIESLKTVVHKVVKGPVKKIPETKDEERERFKFLYQEEKRITFTRGDETVVYEDVQKVQDENIGEADEQDIENQEEEDEEDDDISNEDRIVTKLQALQNLDELTQLKNSTGAHDAVSRWEECCAMFRHDPKETGTDKLVTITGLKTKIYQYQAFGVYWQMMTSRVLGGGFLADDMGLGKTLSFLAYIVVERQLSVLHREVIKSRAAKDGKHLQEGEEGNCPTSSKPGWIACPCSSASPTSRMPPQSGLRMACVPQGLVGQWWAQWKTHVDVSDGELAMKIVVDHPATFNNISITITDRLSSGETAQNTTRMQAERCRVKDGKVDDRPKEYQEAYLLLTTKETYSKFAKKFETSGQIHDLKKRGEWKPGTRSSLIFGIAMIDECHEEYFKNKGRAQILTNLPTCNTMIRPFVWGYSGTPFSQTPRGVEGVLWAIEKHSLKSDPNFKWEKLDAICKEYDTQIKSNKRDDESVDRILAAFKPFLTRFMIRRTAETKWFGGRSLIKLQPHVHQDVFLKPNDNFDALIPAFEAKFDSDREDVLEQFQGKWDNFPESRRSDIRPTTLGFNVICRISWRSRVLATFPYLFKLATTDVEADRLALTVEEVQSFKSAIDKKEFNSPYGRHLKRIIEGSPKCMWLYNLIPQILSQKDVDGNCQKLVILTNFPQVAFILKLFIQRYFPEEKDRVGVIAGRMKASEKSEIINGFTDAVDLKGKRKSKKDICFLIGTSRLLGVGLQLTRACNVVLMEPDNEFIREMQAYARVHRIGQKNPISRSYRLIDSGSEIEEAILKRQRDRKEFAGREIGSEEAEEIQKTLV